MDDSTRRTSERRGGAVMVVVAMAWCLLALLVMGASSSNSTLNVMVPAYFDPSDHQSEWSALNSAAASLPNRLVAIANADSGPGATAQSTYTAAIQALQANSGRIIGYVYTHYGNLSLASVEADVDLWFEFYPSIDGIFFDEVANEDGLQAYYQTLYNYVKSKNSTSLVVNNPGASTLESYLIYNGSRVADIICVFESNISQTTWTQATWTSSYDRSNFFGIFYNVSDLDYGDVIDHAYEQNIGWIYVTDDNGDNPYDTLASYFSEEVAYILDQNYLASS